MTGSKKFTTTGNQMNSISLFTRFAVAVLIIGTIVVGNVLYILSLLAFFAGTISFGSIVGTTLLFALMMWLAYGLHHVVWVSS